VRSAGVAAISSCESAPPNQRMELAGAASRVELPLCAGRLTSAGRALTRPRRLRPQLMRDSLGSRRFKHP
jgi:hypothetical protein